MMGLRLVVQRFGRFPSALVVEGVDTPTPRRSGSVKRTHSTQYRIESLRHITRGLSILYCGVQGDPHNHIAVILVTTTELILKSKDVIS